MTRPLFWSVALPVILAGVCAGCGMTAEMADAQHKADTVATSMESEFGTKPFVGWMVANGTLATVTVTFPVSAVAKMPVGELEAKVRAEVTKHFDKAPQSLNVMVTSSR